MAEIKSLLDEVIEQEIENVGTLSPGSDEKSKAIQNLATLHKLRIEEIKADTEAEELELKERELNSKEADRTYEEKLQNCQVKAQTVERYMKFGMEAAGLVLPLICYGLWFGMGLTFESENSFTSTTFKNLLNRFRPTKKG